MSTKNLAREVESIALALSEENGYEYYHIDDELRELAKDVSYMQEENAKLRGQLCDLHMAYIGTLNECESLNEGLICEYSSSVEADVAKSRARFKADRHRFDAALRELGVEVDG